jgi:hypothetical protein
MTQRAHCPKAALAPVDGCAARAHARALRVDLGRPALFLVSDRGQLKGNGGAGPMRRFR